MKPLQQSLRRLQPHVRQTKRELVTTAARGFVREVVAITPPSNGTKRGPAAKKAGEASIAADLSRIFQPLPDPQIEQFRQLYGNEREEAFGHAGAKPLGTVRARVLTLSEMTAWHQQRRRRDGRVMKVNRDSTTGLRKRDLAGLDVGIVRVADFKKFFDTLKKNVGILAAGWIAAAEGLKVSLPAWVRRHGNGSGNIITIDRGNVFRLELTNEVSFIGNVREYERRVQRALNVQAKKMDRQADHLLNKALKKAGW